jgi:acetylornithine deacetylase/succinyl-diaminopimelate desuccinylase family protein
MEADVMPNNEGVVERLKACIALPTPNPPGEVEAVAAWISEFAQGIGAKTERQTVEPGKDNVIVTLAFGDGPCLLWNTHMDVNTPNGQDWSHPPFEPVIRDGKLYGLGACDAKGSLVAMMCAMERIARDPGEVCGKLVLTAVMGEEAGGIGSLHLVRQGIQADGAVVGEPTQLEAAIAHKGTYMRRIRFRGRSAHSGRPELGINAISHASRFVLEVDKLNARLQQTKHPLLGSGSTAVTVIQGGTRQNTIPNAAELILDRRLIPGQTHADADAELEALIDSLKETTPDLDVESVETIVATIPSETAAEEKIVSAALLAIRDVKGVPKQPVGFRAGCDMSKLVTFAGIPTVILGPGSLEQAHAPDEFVEIAQLEQAVLIYERLARRFLGR